MASDCDLYSPRWLEKTTELPFREARHSVQVTERSPVLHLLCIIQEKGVGGLSHPVDTELREVICPA